MGTRGRGGITKHGARSWCPFAAAALQRLRLHLPSQHHVTHVTTIATTVADAVACTITREIKNYLYRIVGALHIS